MFAPAVRQAALLIVFTATSACVHIDNLGNPPTDDELANDGSPEQRIELRQKYAIAYEDGSFFKPGDGTTKTDRAPQSPTTGDNSLRYLEFAPEARQSLDSGLPFVARITASTEAGWIALGTGFGLGVIGSLVFAIANEAQSSGNLTNVMSPTLLVTAAFSGLLFGGIVGILLYLINDLAVKPVLNGLAADGYRGAARMFNEELERRIEKNATVPAAAAAPPSVPVAPPAPASAPAAPPPPPPATVEPPVTENDDGGVPLDDASNPASSDAPSSDTDPAEAAAAAPESQPTP
jgi:hypothetical protein